MASTTSRSSQEIASSSPTPPAPSAAPVFSYAQAAKGRAAVAGTTAQSSQQTSGTSTPARDATSKLDAPPAPTNGISSHEISQPVTNGTHDGVSKADVAALPDSNVKVDPSNASSQSSPHLVSVSGSSAIKDDELTLSTRASSDSVWERHAQSTTSSSDKERSTDNNDDYTKGKKAKKGKGSESDSEREKEEPKVELVAAPIPTVNFWQQRKDAQTAKTKSPVLPPTQSTSDDQSYDLNSTSHANNLASAKIFDAKKRVKSSANDHSGNEPATQANGQSHPINKSTRKVSGAKDDASPKRAGPRGSRLPEKEEKSTNQLPPPVEDAISWPTPETAVEGDKKKAQEKAEKEERDESTAHKPRTKEKWVPVPYTPTVTFNTPLPVRGGRGRGGARGGRDGGSRGNHLAGGNNSTDRASGGAVNASNATGDAGERKDDANGGRAASLPPSTIKRSSTDPVRDQRKMPSGHGTEKRNGVNGPARSENGSNLTTATQMDPTFDGLNSQQSRGPRTDSAQSDVFYRGGNDRRGESSFGSDNTGGKENQQGRERADGRSDRGRGGYRGRGIHNVYPAGQQQHGYTNGHGPQQLTGFPGRQGPGPYSPPINQPPQFSAPYTQAPSRGGRGGTRSQSMASNNMFGRYPQNGNGAQAMSAAPVYEFAPMQPMGAVPLPYGAFVDQYSVLAMVTMQLEYYFSIDNLCKDIFLRKHMDSQGFVFLSFIAGFKRIQALTQDFELLRFACQESDILDAIKGEDGIDRVRRQEGWEKWVLNMDERDESVKTPGPTYHHRQPPLRAQQMGPMMGQGMTSPPFSPNGSEPSYRPFMDHNAVAINGHHHDAPLSATVAEFAPAQSNSGSVDPLEAENTFTDEEVENLQLVFAPQNSTAKGTDEARSKLGGSRTFSNGSIDGRSISEELFDAHRPGRTQPNGSPAEIPSEDFGRSKTPLATRSADRTLNNSPPVMWVKDTKKQAPVPEQNFREAYGIIRARALKHRDSSAPGETHADMKLLYEFWSHFLCRNFNAKMYHEFRRYARDDANRNTNVGMQNLIMYYDEILNSKKKSIATPLAEHYVELVQNEMSKAERPAFAKLRASWRNGALDIKSRKKISNIIDQRLKDELEA